MTVRIHFKKPQYDYIAENVKKPYYGEQICDVNMVIQNKQELVIYKKDGTVFAYKRRHVSDITVKEANNE